MAESQFLRAALAYADKNWHVFPCAPKDKVPLTKTGFKEATTDKTQIRLWASLYPDANIGIATGASGLFVLDVDPRHGGSASLGKLLHEIPEITNAFTVKTGGGGFHFYFRLAEGQTFKSHGAGKKLGEGIDIRCAGGYVVAPASIHPNGTPYTWQKETVGKDKVMPGVPEGLASRLEASGKLFNGPASESVAVIQGNRNNHLTSFAGILRKSGMVTDEIHATLISYNQLHCNPPLPDEEILQIATSIGNYQINQPWTFGAANFSSKREGKKILELTPYSDIVHEEMTWLWDGRIPEGKFSIMAGVPGEGKTYMECSIAAYLSTGRQFPDDPQNLLTGHRKPMSVLLCTYEDGQGDVLRGRLEKCGADLSRIYTIRHTNPLFTINDVDALETTLDAHPEIRAIFIDPISAIMVGVDDHRDSAFRQAMQPLNNMCMNRKISVVAVKHLNKDSRGDIKSRLGGTIAYLGLARSVLLVGQDNLKEPVFEPQFRHPTMYGGMVQIKQNLGAAEPISYKIDDNGFHWGELDRELTAERLLPRRPGQREQ